MCHTGGSVTNERVPGLTLANQRAGGCSGCLGLLPDLFWTHGD